MRTIVVLLVAVCILNSAVLVLVVLRLRQIGSAQSSPFEDYRGPELGALVDLEPLRPPGGEASDARLTGTLVALVAPECTVCEQTLSSLEKGAKKHNFSTIKAWAGSPSPEIGIKSALWPSADVEVFLSGDQLAELGVQGFPTLLLVDRYGHLIAGSHSYEGIAEAMQMAGS